MTRAAAEYLLRPTLFALLGLLLSGLGPTAAPGQGAEPVQTEMVGWEMVPDILRQIVPPVFPDRDFAIAAFGAVADNQADIKPALDQAIAACHDAGGGWVVVPKSEWFIAGPIHLKSNLVINGLPKGN